MKKKKPETLEAKVTRALEALEEDGDIVWHPGGKIEITPAGWARYLAKRQYLKTRRTNYG